MTLRFWKCGSVNEEVQRLATWRGKFREFDQIFPVFAAFRSAMNEFRLRTRALERGDLSQKHRFPLIRESGGYAFAG